MNQKLPEMYNTKQIIQVKISVKFSRKNSNFMQIIFKFSYTQHFKVVTMKKNVDIQINVNQTFCMYVKIVKLQT